MRSADEKFFSARYRAEQFRGRGQEGDDAQGSTTRIQSEPESEEPGRIGIHSFRERVVVDTVKVGKKSAGVDHVARFIRSHASDGFGAEVGGIGFDHESFDGYVAGGLGNLRGTRKGDNAGEADMASGIEYRPERFEITRIAVEDAPGEVDRRVCKNGKQVIHRFPAVQYDRQVDARCLDCFEVRFKQGHLLITGRRLVVPVEPEFSPGDATRMFPCLPAEMKVGELF